MLRSAYLSVGLILLCTSCVDMLPDQFSPNDIKQDQIFSIDQITKEKCYIKTFEPVESGSLVSQAQNIVLESNQSDSVVFNSKSSLTPPVINNLPVVKYEVRGSPFCKTLLSQKEIRLVALPHSSYEVYFQITGTHLRVLMSGALHELPYQRLSQAIPLSNEQYAIPVGGYPLQQGQIRNKMNVDNQETHILDFFPNEEPMQIVQSHAGIPQKIRKEANEIYIPELNSGFSSFNYQDKPDVLPKTYFEGVWYSGVSIVSTKILSRNSLIGSGFVLSGDSYSNYTPGQKVSFKFESGQLTAINEHYRKQGDDLDHPAEAEVLSIPVKHFDYRNTLETLSADEDLEEPLSNNLSWEDKRYVSLNFSQVDDFHKKRVRAVAHKYADDSLEEAEMLTANPFVTVKEVRFAPDYFDFIIDDGAVEYRFSFFKEDPSKKSTYQPKTIARADPRFEFFRLQYNKIFPDPLRSFRVDYEDQIRLLRPHPNDKRRVPIYFSNFTSHDDLIRSIGREAVSLWNQALSMAGLSWRLYLDETKDVNIGDNRYHILNMPSERNRRYAGVAQFYADPETGELIATTSNVIIPDIKESLEDVVIGYAYEKYNLLNPLRRTSVSYPVSIGKSFIFQPKEKTALSYSVENLYYLLFTNRINQLSKTPFPKAPRSFNEVHPYLNQMAQSQNMFNQPISQIFSNNFTALTPELKDWLRNFKIAYALKQGRFMEDDNFEQIQSNIKNWGLENRREYAPHDSNLTRILDQVCHDIDSPIVNRGGFEVSVKNCVQKIYPIYALGVTVHELGHSLFSLRHNFAASTDYRFLRDRSIQNYKIKHLAPYLTYTNKEGKTARVDSWFRNDESSSVMDYIKFSDGEQWAPGAYDIAAIHYLFDGNQKREEELNVKEVIGFLRPKNRKKINRGLFKRCSDWDVGSSAYCLTHDLGSTPHEIALNEIKSLFYIMDQYFYNQDRFISNSAFYSSIFRKIWNLMVIYQDWRKHLDDYSRYHFNTTIEHLNETQSSQLFSKFMINKKKTTEEKELLSFYQARNLIYHTLTYLAFLPNRYCVLQKNWSSYKKKKWKPDSSYILLELSKVISTEESLNGEQQIYPILSCLAEAHKNENENKPKLPKPHPAVARYIERHYPDYSLKREIGHFLYSSPLPKDAPYKEANGRAYRGTNLIRYVAFAALTLTGPMFPVPLANRAFALSMMNERDIQKGLERLLLARMTQGAFYPVSEFFKSFDDSELKHLSPERSAENLFRFPSIENGKPDLVFRDEFIQLQQLTSNYEKWPQSRTDYYPYGRKFYQNFSEEKYLLHVFSNLYSIAYMISGGLSNDSMSERRTEVSSDIHVEHSRTSNLLIDKALKYSTYRKYPHLSALYYFELGDFLILPNPNVSSDSFGNRILSEMAKNSARMLWTGPYKKSFEGENLYTNDAGKTLKGGFGYHLYNYLSSLLSQFQNTRLGRFYFMYAYSLALSLLDGYEKAITFVGTSSQEFHTQAITSSRLLEQSVLSLFGFSYCNSPQLFEEFQRNIEHNTSMQSETLRTREEFEQNLFDSCAPNPAKTGKMHRLFIQEGQLLNRFRSFGLNNFVLGSPYIEVPSFFHIVWEGRLNVTAENFQNRMLLRDVRNIENHLATKNGIEGIHTAIKMLFQATFPAFLEDGRSVRQWVQFNRQILIDIIPKLMLMYSEDRRFVGEFMLLMSVMHRFCSDGQISGRQCRLVIEKFVGHYFRGSDYGSDPQLELLFNMLLAGNVEINGFSNEEIPWLALFTDAPRDYKDRNVTSLALNIETISDYLFYEKGWDTMHADLEELTAQRDLLFTVLPLGNLRLLDSSNFALSGRIDLSEENE